MGFSKAPVVVKPHDTEWLEVEKGSEKSTDEGDETTENWNCTCDNVGADNDAESAAEPDHPMGHGVDSKMLGSTEETEEEEFCWKL